MTNFISKSFAELEHVVWPTHIESKKFFKSVVYVIIGMTLFTFILASVFSSGYFAFNKLIHGTKNADITASPVVNATIDPASIQGGTIEVAPETKPVEVQK